MSANVVSFARSALLKHLIRKPNFWTTPLNRGTVYLTDPKELALKNFKWKVPRVNSDDVPEENFLSQILYERFLSYYPGVIEEIREYAETCDPFEKGRHVTGVVEHQTAEGGKKIVGITVVESFKILKPEATEDEITTAYKLGWAAELIVDSFFLLDDIMDVSPVRHDKASYHLLPGNEHTTAYDSWLHRAAAFFIILKHAKNHKNFPAMVKIFNLSAYKCSYGQWMTAYWVKDNIGIENLTMARYNTVTGNIGGLFVGGFPFTLGAYLAGYDDPTTINRSLKFYCTLGQYFVMLDDFTDYFCDVPGFMVGNDIEEGRGRWLIAAAVERATPEQMDVLRKHLGKKGKENLDIIMKLLVEMKIPEFFFEEKKRVRNFLSSIIDEEDDPKFKTLYQRTLECFFDIPQGNAFYE